MSDSSAVQGLIVVGMDGSPQSIDALRWAVTQAERTGSKLVAVLAWRVRMPGVEVVAAVTDVEAETRTVSTQPSPAPSVRAGQQRSTRGSPPASRPKHSSRWHTTQPCSSSVHTPAEQYPTYSSARCLSG